MYQFGWYIGILGIIVGLLGSWKFTASMNDMSGPAKKSFIYLVIASSLYIIFSGAMVILGLLGIGLDNILWQIIPILFSLSTIFFVVGSIQMLSALEEIKRRYK